MGSPLDARGALLTGLIDHAPLFPPASLALAQALDEDERARASVSSFALGRFVCPASRLGELAGLERALSVVLDVPFVADERVEAVEVPVGADLAAVPAGARETYVEVRLDDGVGERLAELAVRGVRAKVRCGGASTPSVAELAHFLRACRELGLPFKATAGLHHALRRGPEHGLVNLLAAVSFGEEEEALQEEDAGAFTLTGERFSWRRRSVSAGELVGARALLRSVGSCSFFEPVGELEELGFLPPSAESR